MCKDTQRLCEDGVMQPPAGEHWIAASHQKLRKVGSEFSLEPPERAGPADSLISDCSPPNYGEINF